MSLRKFHNKDIDLKIIDYKKLLYLNREDIFYMFEKSKKNIVMAKNLNTKRYEHINLRKNDKIFKYCELRKVHPELFIGDF